ncbi:DUF2075 domain-containing protein [Luteimonas sp. A649]
MTAQQSTSRGVLRRFGYGAEASVFLKATPDDVIGQLTRRSRFNVEQTQVRAWQGTIDVIKSALTALGARGHVFLEFDIPRMGRRVDVVLVLDHVVFVIEFKVGAQAALAGDIDQVIDYALDLKHFHEPSHQAPLVPVLVATAAPAQPLSVATSSAADGLFDCLSCNADTLGATLNQVLCFAVGPMIDAQAWVAGRYRPTPTIVEAAMALYARHSVVDISRSDAANLGQTSGFITGVIQDARAQGRKALCFVTGVPGAGKTLVGLDVATQSTEAAEELHAVYLSGNGPLVKVLHEALARDKVRREAEVGSNLRIGDARRQVKSFIQAVHHFRDEGLSDSRPPHDHVAIFDEAQRAWDREQTASFMQRKRGLAGFDKSEPEFLISCLDRHHDWAVVVCLVGTGQEINRGEAGIGEWLASLSRSFPDWQVYVSPSIDRRDPVVTEELASARERGKLHEAQSLHLATSVRSFRSERVSEFVNRLLDLDVEGASGMLAEVTERFPILLTRDLGLAKIWVRARARGTERYGMVVSSQAQRLKPHAIDVRVPIDPVHWFLAGKDDTRSSYYLEDVATEFQVQGLELDWSCVVWDGDLRYLGDRWGYFGFVGDSWKRVLKDDRRRYLLNAYRVLLTRARQGTVIVVPRGDAHDPTRTHDVYDHTYELLRRVGMRELPAVSQEVGA